MKNKKGTLTIFELETPSKRQNACNGAVRKMVNKLPFWSCRNAISEPVISEARSDFGESSSAADSPFSAPCIAWTNICKMNHTKLIRYLAAQAAKNLCAINNKILYLYNYTIVYSYLSFRNNILNDRLIAKLIFFSFNIYNFTWN